MKDLNVLEFSEIELGIKLYPLQKTLLKIIFGVPLDYQPQTIDVWDDLHEYKLYTLSEPDYLKMCLEECRCNYGDWRSLPANGFNEAHLFQGRRGGKSTLLMVASAYKLYHTLQLGDPQRFFNLIPGAQIDLTLVGMDDNSIQRMHQNLYDLVNYQRVTREGTWNGGFFSPYMASFNPGRSIKFFTEADRRGKNLYASINVGAIPATSNSSRGVSSIGLFLDEFAHYKKAGDLYDAAVPSTMNYHNASGNYSLVMSAASPWYTNGKMFQLHELAFKELQSSVFTHNETTATLCPGASYMNFRQQKAKGNKFFEVEFCGKFIHPHFTGGHSIEEYVVTFKEYLEGKGSR
jgi:hypothetical protein